jgi:hypothetical protein
LDSDIPAWDGKKITFFMAETEKELLMLMEKSRLRLRLS